MAWINILFLAVLGLSCFCSHWCNATPRVCFISVNDHRPYDDEKEICCQNTLRPRVRYQECCGDSAIYFKNTHLCCGGKVMERFSPPKGSRLVRECLTNESLCREQDCCENKLVDKENTMCCQNTTIYLTQIESEEKNTLECCGDKIVNKYTQFCCNEKAYNTSSTRRCCGTVDYDVNVEKCLDQYSPHRVVKKYSNFCGDEEYDTRRNSCCSGTLNNVPELDPDDWTKANENRRCCDQHVYNEVEKKCCRKSHTGFSTHTIPQMENIYCCGDGFYDATSQDCYKGKVLERVPGRELCGYNYIDGSSKGCCGGDQIYNINSQDCCEGDTFNIISKNEDCCNGIGINSSKLCCENIKPCEKNDKADDKCCYNFISKSGKTYNSNKNEFCVEGQVMRTPPETEPCGKFNYYNPKTQICCEHRIENITSGNDQCCGDKPYNSKLQQCCNFEVSNIPSTEGSCCLDDWNVYRFSDANNPCRKPCGDRTYDSTNEICCEGRVYARTDSSECCGSSVINVDTTECCGERFPFPKNKGVKCCGDKELYDERFSKCSEDGEKIVPVSEVQRNQSDVQKLCNPTALKHFDGGIKYACESLYAVRARIVGVQITGKRSSTISIKILLSDVKNLIRGENFTTFSGQQNLHFTIKFPNKDGIICRKGFLDRFCEVFVFFDAKVRNGHVKITNTSKFFMAGYTKKWEKLITNHLTYQFCHTHFNIYNSKGIANL